MTVILGDGISVTSLDASYRYIFCMYTHTLQYAQPIASCTIPTQPSPTLPKSPRSISPSTPSTEPSQYTSSPHLHLQAPPHVPTTHHSTPIALPRAAKRKNRLPRSTPQRSVTPGPPLSTYTHTVSRTYVCTYESVWVLDSTRARRRAPGQPLRLVWMAAVLSDHFTRCLMCGLGCAVGGCMYAGCVT